MKRKKKGRGGGKKASASVSLPMLWPSKMNAKKEKGKPLWGEKGEKKGKGTREILSICSKLGPRCERWVHVGERKKRKQEGGEKGEEGKG